MFFSNLLLYIVSFVFIWFGSGLIVSSASKFSTRLKLSSFAFSFVFLGLLTSAPEFSVGLQAVSSHNPEIFVGNLLGGILVLFLIIIPLLAIFGNGVSLKNELGNKTLLATIGVILAPSIVVLDKKVTNPEGLALVILYLILLYFVERKHGIFDRHNSQMLNAKAYSFADILKILLGIGLVFASSAIIVDKTMYFAGLFNMSAFYIGLIVVALGTNMPEMSLAVRSVIENKKDIAMGDYLGSAAANTLLFGIFTLLSGGEVLTVNNFLLTFIFVGSSLMLFYYFSYSKKYISRNNGFALLGIYIFFVVLELMK